MRMMVAFLASALTLAASPALGHGGQMHGGQVHGGPTSGASPMKREQTAWGIAGDPKQVRRTVEFSMGDDMRFQPARLTVRLGETVRFIVHNRGRAMHEFVIGTKAENVRHAELMIKFPDMEHDAPYMAHVAPGQRGEIVWTFNRPGEFEFACLIAGHYTSGMVGTIVVTKETT